MTNRQLITSRKISSGGCYFKANYFITRDSMHIRDREVTAYGLSIEQRPVNEDVGFCSTAEKTHYFLFSQDEAAVLACRLESLEVTPLGLHPALSELREDF